MKGELLSAADITAPLERRCDVCIIGSGAGGSVMAAELVARGLDVVMIEEGSHYHASDFTLQEKDAIPAMYQDRGARTTADGAITIMQGRTVGGSTTVNWTTCFRTPDRILRHWQSTYGVPLDPSDLAEHFDAIEERLSISRWPLEQANKNNQALLRGCERLGFNARGLRRNVKGCANTGYCGLGCPVEAKQAMAVTYLRDALEGGLTLLSNVRVEHLDVGVRDINLVRGRVISPQAGAPDGVSVRIKPKVVVSSAGAINGPALLLRSGLTGGGRVGYRTFLHPVVGALGLYEEPIEPYYGAPQSVGCHDFIDRGAGRIGFFLETAPMQPMMAAVALDGFGDALQFAMQRLPNASALIALCVDGVTPGDDGGVVSLRSDGSPRLDYPVRKPLAEAFGEATKVLSRIHLAAGANEVRPIHVDDPILRSESDLPILDKIPYGAHRHPIFTAHQMGGCAMGADAKLCPTRPDFRLRGPSNLFIVDGSVLPTALGVNPSETIYALARHAAPIVASFVY